LGFGEKAQVNYLKKIATASGGFFLFTPNSEELIHLYGKLLEQIKNQYQIEFTFDNPPGVYNANLKFDYQGKEVRAQRRFAHVSMEPAIPPSPPVNPPLVATSAPWFATAWPWVPLLLVISIAGFSLLYLYLRRQSETPRLKADEAKSGPASMMAKGKIHPLSSSADKFVTSRATVIFQTPGEVGLRIDIPPVPIFFPLIDRKNNKNYEAVIITRYDDADRKFFSEKHNYILLGDNTVSRPDGNRLGHARIFLDPDTNRYQIEDLGSSGGTSLGENPLTGKIVLENRDTITVGAVSINFYDKRPTTETIF
jgi:hypothetical protein